MTLQKYHSVRDTTSGLAQGIPWIGPGHLPEDIYLEDERGLVDPRNEFPRWQAAQKKQGDETR